VGEAREPEQAKRPKILMVLTSHDRLGETGRRTGFYLSEAAHPYAQFVGRGYAVDFVSPRGGRVPIDGLEAADPVARTFAADRVVKRALETTLTPDQVDAGAYVAIFFVGGHGTMWDFPDNAALQTITASIYERGGVVAAVCHGPAALVNVKLSDGTYLVSGKTVTSFTDTEENAVGLADVVPFLLESKLVERGATIDKAADFKRKVVVSGRLLTGQNPASATDLADAVLLALKAR